MSLQGGGYKELQFWHEMVGKQVFTIIRLCDDINESALL